MNSTTSQYQGHFGILMNVTSFTVLPKDRPTLRQVFFCELGAECRVVSDLIVEMYDRILAGNLACEMVVSVSKPLLRGQADLLNEQRVTVSRLLSSAVGGAIKPISNVAALVATGASYHAFQKLTDLPYW